MSPALEGGLLITGPSGRFPGCALLVTCILSATDAIIFVFCFSFPAIYNYNASQDVELSLQVGDTVHILEMYEGKSDGLLPDGWGGLEQYELLTHKGLLEQTSTQFTS